MAQARAVQTYDVGDPMPPEYRDLVVHLILNEHLEVIGNPEYVALLDRFWDAAMKLDTSEQEKVRIVSYIMQETGHGYIFWKMLRDLGVEVKQAVPIKHYVFHMPYETLADFGFFTFLADRVGKYQFENMEGCSYLPLARIAGTIVKHEVGHYTLGHEILERLLHDGQRAHLQDRLEVWYPAALDMFGRSESTRQWQYIAHGIKRWPNEELRQRFIREVNPILAGEFGFALPDEKANRRFL